ncbi:FUSC family protein [Vibrio rumoiensis]|uniref:Fusaric acid resistance protein n=1 Tax=Vibrio rumoiensis 1S-45 TaxID=1188252 RepID=A0A1E5E743_9VIBR|nr:FUSC family protein [Vibrio rumoiensis]OEF30108.1 fusaric acid resistance protein [Vibrio rumoiensis 1S-45]
MLSWLDWRNTPWGKATGVQWRYAIRNACALILALYIAFVLQMSEPYWAMTSAAVVSFPTFGGVISKSLGRIVGSLFGAFAALLIVGLTLNEPWLFIITMSAWMGVCTYIANHYQNNVSYAFLLAGYTAAIIAYSAVNSTDSEVIFEIAQARVGEVIIGILCSGFMMMVLPSTSDGTALLSSLRGMQTSLTDHFERLLQPQAWHSDVANKDLKDPIRESHEQVISQILSMNLLRIQAYWSHHQLRSQDQYLNHLLHQQMRMTTQISSLRRMLVNWNTPPEGLSERLEDILHALKSPTSTQYNIAKILATFKPSQRDDFRYHAFWQRLQQFCWIYLRAEQTLQGLESTDPSRQRALGVVPKTARVKTHTDSYEAAYNGLRTFVCLFLCSAFWIQTQWDEGGIAVTLAAVSLMLNASTPSPVSNVLIMLRALVMLFVACFVVKFGILVQINSFEVFAVLLFVVLLTMNLLRVQSVRNPVLWAYLIVFMGSLLAVTNPPEYDYQGFVNGGIAQIVGLLFSAIAFQILKPSSDRRRNLRLARSLKEDFIDQLSERPPLKSSQFESLVYHRMNQISQSKDIDSKLELLRLGVVILNCHHIVWQLRERVEISEREKQARQLIRTVFIEAFFSISIKQTWLMNHEWQHQYCYSAEKIKQALQCLLWISDAFSTSEHLNEREFSGIVWRLYCSLKQIEQDIFDQISEEVVELNPQSTV